VAHARASRGADAHCLAAFDPEIAKAEEIVVPVQVNGKLRARLTVPPRSAKRSFVSVRWRPSPATRLARPSKRLWWQKGRW
jgi:hypothetical protein